MALREGAPETAMGRALGPRGTGEGPSRPERNGSVPLEGRSREVPKGRGEYGPR